MKKTHFYSFLPFLDDTSGHIYEYNLKVQKAVELNQWNYVAFVPKYTQIEVLPKNWKKKLPKFPLNLTKPTLLQRLKVCLLSFFPFKKQVASIQQENAIIFLEHFLLLHFFPLTFALLFRKKKVRLWLLHRYLPSSKKAIYYRFFHALFRKILGKNQLILLTDSELLQKEQKKVFHTSVFLVPIPHGKISVNKPLKSTKEIHLWWPGGQLREAKGVKEIQKLVLEIQKGTSKKFQLTLAESGKKYFSDQAFLSFTKTALSRQEYETYLAETDIVLLPYCPTTYKYSTSGILIETLLAGSTPVVKEGSWLAHQLSKLDLSELILDWEKPILPQLMALFPSSTIEQKIRRAKEKLSSYHCEEKLAKIFQEMEKNSL